MSFNLERCLVKNQSVLYVAETLNNTNMINTRNVFEKESVDYVYDYFILQSRPLVIIDIGANVGCFSLLPAISSHIMVYAFEPNKKIYDILIKNIKLNNIESRVYAKNIALANMEGEVELRIPKDPKYSGVSTIGRQERVGDYYVESVRCNTLDNEIPDEIDHVDLIKIDVEGAELLVLEGARKVIEKHKPAILIEYQDIATKQFDYNKEKIKEILIEYGYSDFKDVGNGNLFAGNRDY